MAIFHPLHSSLTAPERFTYPFHYVPHPLALQACKELQQYISNQKEWAEELANGKMFGVLVARDDRGQMGFLAAYSGLLDGSNNLDYFVPAVFDLLKDGGEFKRAEHLLDEQNRIIAEMEHSEERHTLMSETEHIRKQWDDRMKAFRQQMADDKKKRDLRRKQGNLTEEDSAELIRQSQYQKAELRRLRQAAQEAVGVYETRLEQWAHDIDQRKTMRKEFSNRVQRDLFKCYRLLNARGEMRTVADIFEHDMHAIPPSGTGECCAPKLLQWAYSHQLHPVCMAEFWWGRSPKTEVRHHLHFYPACRSKCKPLLEFMLQGLDVDSNPLASDPHALQPEIILEDEWLAVVSKPCGMLSVPGKDDRSSVLAWAQKQWPEADGPLLVHRLDMDTSGLLLIAKSKKIHEVLQAEFINREVKKRYTAVLAGTLSPGTKRSGTIHLPLRPDLNDRPRQLVDSVYGKQAITSYRVLADNGREMLVALYPHTGRTHQLRVHCACHDGLNCPIKGDPIYGKPADRMYLHAEELRFLHPVTGEPIIVKAPTPFTISPHRP